MMRHIGRNILSLLQTNMRITGKQAGGQITDGTGAKKRTHRALALGL